MLDRMDFVKAIADFRRNFQHDVDGQNLIDVNVSLGCLLYDLTEALQMTEEETVTALGAQLYNDVQGEINGQLTFITEGLFPR